MKKLFYILTILLSFTMVACNGDDERVKLSIFNIKEATTVAMNYMNDVTLGDFEKSKIISSKRIIENEEIYNFKSNNINGYKLDLVQEGADHAYFTFLIIKEEKDESRVDLDKVVLKVIKEDNSYLVDGVKASNEMQVYKVDDTIRLRSSDVGKSQLVLRLKDLPKEVYPNMENIVVHKDEVPTNEFSKLSISFSGDKIAFLTRDNEKSYIALATIDNSKATIANAASAEDITNSLEDALETPIISKLYSYDVVKGVNIEKVLFSNDDGELIVQIREEGKGSGIRVYKNPNGNMLNLNLNELFPVEKYSTDVLKIDDKGIYIKVEATGEENKEEGTYLIDIDQMKVISQ